MKAARLMAHCQGEGRAQRTKEEMVAPGTKRERTDKRVGNVNESWSVEASRG